MASGTDPETIIGDPAWLCHRYDPQFDAFHYVHVPRALHRSVPFLTDGRLGSGRQTIVVARRDAMQLAPEAAPLHFIVHSAFCGSTLLVRMLDLEGSAMGLSEPVVLNDLVGWRRRGASPQEHAPVMSETLRQLARPWTTGEAVVVKPSNVFNGIAAGALKLSPGSRCIILTAPLPVFLASVARKGLECRLWVRELLEGLLQERMVDLGFTPADYFRQTDLQVAAVGWLAQQALFMRMLEHFGPDRIATLSSEDLVRDPAPWSARAAAFFGLPATAVDHYRASPALGRNSKSGMGFTPADREAEQRDAAAAHGDEIDKVTAWSEAVARQAGVPLQLSRRLS